jgi:hypothetical protein
MAGSLRMNHERRLVRKGGFEPPRYCYRQPLKLVRLPVPPLSLRRVAGLKPALQRRGAKAPRYFFSGCAGLAGVVGAGAGVLGAGVLGAGAGTVACGAAGASRPRISVPGP